MDPFHEADRQNVINLLRTYNIFILWTLFSDDSKQSSVCTGHLCYPIGSVLLNTR